MYIFLGREAILQEVCLKKKEKEITKQSGFFSTSLRASSPLFVDLAAMNASPFTPHQSHHLLNVCLINNLPCSPQKTDALKEQCPLSVRLFFLQRASKMRQRNNLKMLFTHRSERKWTKIWRCSFFNVEEKTKNKASVQ